MKRKEMDPKYQWDFTHIYPDKAAWEAAMAEAEQAVAGLAALPGTLKVSKEGLKKGLDAAYAAMEKIELSVIYANLHKSADGSEPEHQAMDARAMTLMVKGMSMLAFLNPEILSIPEAAYTEEQKRRKRISAEKVLCFCLWRARKLKHIISITVL